METPPIQRSPLLYLYETGIREPFTEHLTPEVTAALSDTCSELKQGIQTHNLESQVFALNLIADIEGLDFSETSEKIRAFKEVLNCLRVKQLQQCPSQLGFISTTINGSPKVVRVEDCIRHVENKYYEQPLEQFRQAIELISSDSEKAIELYREARATPGLTRETIDNYLPDFLVALAQVDSNKVYQIALEDEIDMNILNRFAQKVAPFNEEIALSIAEIQVNQYSCSLILEPVVAAVALKDLDRALELAGTIPDIFFKKYLLTSIAQSIAPTNFRKALEILDECFPIDPEYNTNVETLIKALLVIAPKLNSNEEQEIIVQRFRNFAEIVLSHSISHHDVRLLTTMAKSLAQLGKHDLAMSFLRDCLTGVQEDEHYYIEGSKYILDALLLLENSQQKSELFENLCATLISRIQDSMHGQKVIGMLLPHLFSFDPETVERLFETQILKYFDTLSNNFIAQSIILNLISQYLPVQNSSLATRILGKILISAKKITPNVVESSLLTTLNRIPRELFSKREFVLKVIRSDEFKAIPASCKLQFLLKALAAMPEKFPDVQDRLFDLVKQQVA